MTADKPARPHWARSLAWVLASVAAAGLLALMAQALTSLGGHKAGGPLQLGQAQTWRQAAGTQALAPQQALDTAAWQGVSLPVSAGWTGDTVWLQLQLHNASGRPQSAWLEVMPSRLTTVRLHSQAADGQWQTQASGNGVAGGSRPINAAELVFPLELGPGEQRLVLVEAAARNTPLAVDLALRAAVDHAGQAMRSNLPDLILIGGVLLVGLVSLSLSVGFRHLGLLLLGARALLGTLHELQQFGAGALLLPAALAAALTEHAWLLYWAILVLVQGFIWSFMAQAGVARWVHRVYALFLLSSVAFIVLPGLHLYSLLMLPFMVFTQLLCIHLIFRGYLPAVALLTGGLAGLAVNAPSMLGQPLAGAPRYLMSPLPLLLTLLMLLLAVGWALRRERRQTAAALGDAQRLAMQGLEHEVARRTAELLAARDEARQASQAKSVFLAKVSHELRTPLHALLGYLDLGLRQPLAPALQRQLGIARQAGRQLISQINDLLDHARSERALLKLSPASLSLHSLAQQLQDRMPLLAPEHGNRFTLHCDPRLPAWVKADGSRLEQVLMALLSNAMRYTEGGSVSLHITLEGLPAATGGPLAVRFLIEDSGPGIAPERLARLGEDFERGAATDSQGLGLGLAISRQLLALMDARLVVSSQPGAGSRFSFTLQLPPAAEPVPPPLPAPTARLDQPGRTRQVLVLDDHAASRAYVADLLGAAGLSVLPFAGVAQALAWVRANTLSDETGPDLCIIDQHLGEVAEPGQTGPLTGWDFIHGLRDFALDGGRACPVLLLSATAPQPPEGWAAEPAIAGHLQKPVDPGLLLATVAELLGLGWVAGEQGADADAEPHDGMPANSNANVQAGDASVTAPDDWRALHELAELAHDGSLSGLDAWAAAHPGLLAANPQLQALIDGLDFAGIARQALVVQGS